jgi:hypothetical protein
MGRKKGKGVDDFANAMIAHNNAIVMANSNPNFDPRRGYGLGTGIKENWNNSRLGKNINNFVKKHKNVIDAVRNDESVQNLYHSKHIAPYHGDIDAAVNHFGGGLYAGTGIHHHHHYHMSGHGMWDWADPRKNGVAKAFDPNQNGISNKISNVGKTIRDKMEEKGFNNRGALNTLKKVGHYAIPAATGTLGGLAGSAMGGVMGGMAGSAAGSYAGDQINKKIGIGLHPGQGRFPKGSPEAKEHMARLRAMRRSR